VHKGQKDGFLFATAHAFRRWVFQHECFLSNWCHSSIRDIRDWEMYGREVFYRVFPRVRSVLCVWINFFPLNPEGSLFLHFENGRKRMAFPTTNVRVETRPLGLLTKSCHFDAAPECGCQRVDHLAAQLHKFAGIRPADGRDRAGAAQVTPPGSIEQAALFMVTPAVVVAVEIFTFRSSRCFHFAIIKYYLTNLGRWGGVRVASPLAHPPISPYFLRSYINELPQLFTCRRV